MLDDHRRLRRARQQLAKAEGECDIALERAKSIETYHRGEVKRLEQEVAEFEAKCAHTDEEVEGEVATEEGVKADMAKSVDRAKSFGEDAPEPVGATATKGDTEKRSKKSKGKAKKKKD